MRMIADTLAPEREGAAQKDRRIEDRWHSRTDSSSHVPIFQFLEQSPRKITGKLFNLWFLPGFSRPFGIHDEIKDQVQRLPFRSGNELAQDVETSVRKLFEYEKPLLKATRAQDSEVLSTHDGDHTDERLVPTSAEDAPRDRLRALLECCPGIFRIAYGGCGGESIPVCFKH